MATPDANTKDRILDVAEQLYAEKGFAATSLREIMKVAGVNMASVHYHFGSRTALVEAVIDRKARPVNQARLAGLDALEGRHPDGELPVAGVIDAFLRPVLTLLSDGEAANAAFPRLMGRLAMEPDEELGGVIAKTFSGVSRRFLAALRRALPHLDEAEVFRRLHFLVGAMVFVTAIPNVHRRDEKIRHEMGTAEELYDGLMAFAIAGMNAPAPTPAGKMGDA